MITQDLLVRDLDAKWTPRRQSGRFGLRKDSTNLLARSLALAGAHALDFLLINYEHNCSEPIWVPSIFSASECTSGGAGYASP
jgi:hypothetical protein